MLSIPPAAATLAAAIITDEESIVTHPYWDSVGHVWSQGMGFCRLADDSPVTQHSPPMTLAQCQALLVTKLEADYMPAVMHLCGEILTTGQLAALSSLCWNIGSGALGNSIIPSLARAGAWAGVRAAFQQFIHDHAGHVVQDLVDRRRREGLILLGSTFLPGKRTGEALGTPTRPPVVAVQAHPHAAPQIQPGPALTAFHAILSPAQSVAPAPQSEADRLMQAELNNLGAA